MDNDTLKRLHNSLLMILDEIDRICRNHDIPYFLDSGTALGAVRHGGFIPWDDDADVGMLREHYETFLEVAKNELSAEFFLQTSETDSEYSKFSAKIRLNNTFFPEKREEASNIHHGIFVDIFPFDYISDDQKKAISDIKKMRILNRLYSLRVRHPLEEGILRKIARCGIKIIPQVKIYNTCTRHMTKYNLGMTNHVTCYPYKMNNHMFLIFNTSYMNSSIDIGFEGRQYQIMKGYDEYLKIMYGDYMQLPPVEKRVWHFKGDIKFESDDDN